MPEAEPSAEEGRFVLPLVVRIERAVPPTRTDAMETAARAVLTFLADPRTDEETGEWHKRVRLWEERGIRKVVRRARGSEWRRTEPLEGITLAARTAEVRVFPPVPLDGWPRELSRLQVSGTDLEDPEPPPPPEAGEPVLWLSPVLEMTAGKAMAQAAHAAQLAWWDLSEPARVSWRDAAFPLAVRVARDARHWESLTTSGLPVVRDAGFTEIAPGSCTVVAEHPALRPPSTPRDSG
ncbi:peptidyl-tRNA hydrolase [Streptomyces iconiensis]|uniref:peptidyl-tRNA hydrolase n=1 Tax=Streptomyces iconiensis TaxID=1384038 RepID=A0ABT6ZXK9_9ACTN|nr:peptidyl-tRNA hydrolase [Streptomyces iconiensis]MDJ1133587.1 peptidyl-tRNA hydrolase [Streptomyces iconiensis]